MEKQVENVDLLSNVLETQHLAVLATQWQGNPYTSLIAFAASADLRRIVFVTSRATSKYRNLSACPDVSLLIDTRSHSVDDFSSACAVTAMGQATEHDKEGHEMLRDLFLVRHPHLEAFVHAPSTALCFVEVETYYLVTRFQHVIKLDVSQWPSSSR